MKTPKNGVIVAVGVVLVIAGFAAGYFGQHIARLASQDASVNVPAVELPSVIIPDTNQPEVPVDQGIAVGEPNPSGVPPVTPPVVTPQPEVVATPTQSILGIDQLNNSNLVDWQSPAQSFSKKIKASYGDLDTVWFKVGTFKSGSAKYAGDQLYIVTVPCDGPCFSDSFMYTIIRKDDSYVKISKLSDDYLQLEDLKSLGQAFIDDDFDLPELHFPINVTAKPGVVLNHQPYIREFLNPLKFVPAFVHKTLGQAYFEGTNLDASTRARNGIYFKAADGTLRVYGLTPSISDDKSVPQVTWNDGSLNQDSYASADVGGCGAINLISVVDESVVSQSKDLVLAGKSTSGDVYEFRDVNSEYLKNVYENEYAVYGDQVKVSFEVFVNSHPIFFWRDPFGRLIKFKNNKYVPMVECGKPVIYLYPEKTTAVNVQLEPQGGFTYTEPVYPNGGWNVTAEPNGRLTDSISNAIYPYLFWEGRGGLYSEPTKGFVIKKSEVHSFLTEKLAKQGLNAKEIADFQEFWEPRMQAAPYYFVSFYGNQVMDQLAPLNITPKPDSIIRVLMDFKPLDKPIDVEGYEIKTPERNGFTVVEWGGVIR